MKKRGQLFEKPFMFIFILVVASLILVFGFRIIKDTINLGEDVEVKSFISKFDGEIERIYNLDYGSRSSLKNLNVPSTIKWICFVDRDSTINFNSAEIPDETTKTLIQETGDNVFFVLDKDTDSKFIKNLKPGENPLCIRILGSKLNAVIENKGTFVEVSKL